MSTYLDDPATLCHSRDPATSHDAAKHAIDSGVVASQLCECLRFIASHPDHTTRELGEMHPYFDRFVFGRRVGELVDRKWVRWLDKRPCKYGKPACPCFATELGKAVLRGDVQP